MTAIIDGFRGKTHISLGKQNYVAGATLPFKVPQDIVVKEFIIVVNGYMACTFGGTKPTVNPQGFLHGIISEIQLSRRGTDRVKSIRGTRHLTTTLERKFGSVDQPIYKVNATELGDGEVIGLPVWGTTGQNVALRDSTSLMMENKLSGAWYPSLFNTKGLQTAVLNIICGALSGAQDPTDANVGTYAGSLEIEVFASCSDFMLNEAPIADFNQNFEDKEFGGAVTNSRQWITPQGMLQGMNIIGLHSGNKPINFDSMKKTRLEVKYQGILVAEGSLADFQEIDIKKTNVSRRKGQAYLSFLNNMAFDSGLYIADGKQLELIVTTDSGLSYAVPFKLVFEYDQLIFNPAVSKAA